MDLAAMASAVAYRAKVASTIELAALVVPASRQVGLVLKALQGLLYAHRGVRNVVDLQPQAGEPKGHDSDDDKVVVVLVHQEQRWFMERGGEVLMSGKGDMTPLPLKAILLDPAVLSSSAVPQRDHKISLTPLPLPLDETATTMGLTPALAERLNKAAAAAAAADSASMQQGASPWAVGLTTVTVKLTYENYTMPELLRMVLPSHGGGLGKQVTAEEGEVEDGACGMNNAQQAPGEVVALSGFEQVGHIAHVNLSKSHLPYRYTVGQVILDCNPTVAVVVNKTDVISSEFREFPMQIIAVRFEEGKAGGGGGGGGGFHPKLGISEDELLTATVKQHGCLFEVPYNRVYWNSRLSHEHTRLVAMMRSNDVLFDVMAGVGPFAVPAAKRGVLVFANDLNPASAEYMAVNRAKNKIPAPALAVYNWDGRDFLNTVVYDCVMGLHPLPAGRGRKHVVMNLPATAVEFLDVFAPVPLEGRGEGAVVQADKVRVPPALPGEEGSWHRRHRWNYRPASTPAGEVDRALLIHVYCFSSASDVLEDAVRQVETHLGYALGEENKECVCMVRDVAPQKRMVCVSFTLPHAFWAHQIAVDETGGVDGDGDGEGGSATAARRRRRTE